MKHLILLNFLYVLRSRFLVAILLFTLVVQHLAIRVARSVVLQIQDKVTTVQDHEVFYVAMLIQAGACLFLAVVYGNWGVPYLHRGSRAPLTFTLPVRRDQFLLSYFLVFSALVFVQFVLLLVNYGIVLGFGELFGGNLSWTGFLLSILIVLVSGLFWLFFQASLSVTLGALPGLVFSALGGFILSIGGMVFQPTVEKVIQGQGSWFTTLQWIFDKLPAAAYLPLDIRDALHGDSLSVWRTGVWLFWGVLAVLYLHWKMRKPLLIRGSES